MRITATRNPLSFLLFLIFTLFLLPFSFPFRNLPSSSWFVRFRLLYFVYFVFLFVFFVLTVALFGKSYENVLFNPLLYRFFSLFVFAFYCTRIHACTHTHKKKNEKLNFLFPLCFLLKWRRRNVTNISGSYNFNFLLLLLLLLFFSYLALFICWSFQFSIL